MWERDWGVRGMTGKIFWGGKSLFPIFSPLDFSLFLVEISILVDPDKISEVSLK